MSKGNIQASRSHSGNVGYYLREEECEAYLHSVHPLMAKEEVLRSWKRIEHDEVFGNKALGIRGRHDAQVRTNYMMTMPNDLSHLHIIERVKAIIDKTPIKDCVYTICVHGGRHGEVAENKHVHLLVNERSLVTGKKVRELSQKPFLEKLKGIYRQEFALELSQGKEVASRERIATSLWKASPSIARELCVELQKGNVKVAGSRAIGTEKQRAAITLEHAKIVGVLRRTIAAHTAEKKEILQEIKTCRSQLDKLPYEIAELKQKKADTLYKELRWERERVEEYQEKKKDIEKSPWLIRTMTPGYRKEVLAELEKAEKKYEEKFAAKSVWFDDRFVELNRLRLSLEKRLKEAEQQEERNKKEEKNIPQQIDKAVVTVFDHRLTLEEKKKLIYHDMVQIPVNGYVGKSGVPQDGAIRLTIDETKGILKQKFFTQEEVIRMANMQNRSENIARQIQEESQQRIEAYQKEKKQEQEKDQDQSHDRNRGFGMSR
jgi:hypothetical protein